MLQTLSLLTFGALLQSPKSFLIMNFKMEYHKKTMLMCFFKNSLYLNYQLNFYFVKK